jgi:flagellar biosynthesis activator protein FlaF
VPSNALKAYQNVHRQTLSGRETEARVLTQAALKLVQCQKSWDDEGRDEKLDQALKYTQRVWSVFQVEMVKPENPLPEAIKKNILLLSRFIDRRIFETIAFPSQDKLDILININRNIAAGLLGSPSGPIDDPEIGVKPAS